MIPFIIRLTPKNIITVLVTPKGLNSMIIPKISGTNAEAIKRSEPGTEFFIQLIIKGILTAPTATSKIPSTNGRKDRTI